MPIIIVVLIPQFFFYFHFTVKFTRRKSAIRDSPNAAKSRLWKSYGCLEISLLSAPCLPLKHNLINVNFEPYTSQQKLHLNVSKTLLI